MISHGSFHATRTIGTDPPAWIAWNIETSVASVLAPCCRSTHT